MLKKIFVMCMVVVMLLTTCIGSFALPINVQNMDNYFYNENAAPVAAPVAYRPVAVHGWDTLGIGSNFDPADMCVRDDYLYIVDKKQSQIVVLDVDYKVAFTISNLKDSENYKVPELDIYKYFEDGTREEDEDLKNANKYRLNMPEGVYVSDDGMIYIADTQNRRVVVCDKEGAVYNVIQSVRISSMGVDFVFKPKKIVVDGTGTVSVTCHECNKGLVQVDAQGKFQQFFAQPATKVKATDWIYALVGASSSKKAQITNIAAEYDSITIDAKGFIYTTAIDDKTVASLRKLASDGSDVLTQEDAKFKGFGDVFPKSSIIDVAVNDAAGTYTILDHFMGRFFTYNASGMQLFVGGGWGSQFGKFIDPIAIACFGDDIVIADKTNRLLTVFETTDYALNIIEAQEAYKSGNDKAAEAAWNKVITYNSNMYIAYDTLGKIYKLRGADCEDGDPMRVENYEKAMHYFELSSNKKDYAECYKEVRNAIAMKYFGLIFGSFIVIFVGTVAIILVRGKRKKRAEEKRRAGL